MAVAYNETTFYVSIEMLAQKIGILLTCSTERPDREHGTPGYVAFHSMAIMSESGKHVTVCEPIVKLHSMTWCNKDA